MPSLLGKKEKRELANRDLYMEASKLYLGNLDSRFALGEIALELPILQVLELIDSTKIWL
jgi:hypothetical protein